LKEVVEVEEVEEVEDGCIDDNSGRRRKALYFILTEGNPSRVGLVLLSLPRAKPGLLEVQPSGLKNLSCPEIGLHKKV
jgi:hypothetical protein